MEPEKLQAGTPTETRVGAGRTLVLLLLSWFAVLGIDFFIHAGLLAGLYLEPSPFLLPPVEAFRRIPIGYLSFLLLCGFLLWLMLRLDVRRIGAGFLYGAVTGAAIGGGMVLGLISISTASPDLLLGWLFGYVVELGAAGAVIGAGLAGIRSRRIVLAVVALDLVLVILTIVMQNLGLAPAVVI